jgi:hypothetical protein
MYKMDNPAPQNPLLRVENRLPRDFQSWPTSIDFSFRTSGDSRKFFPKGDERLELTPPTG